MDAGSWHLIDEIRNRGLVGKVWPVFHWDNSPSVFGLIFPRRFVVDEINADRDEPITDRELVAALRVHGFVDYSDHCEARLIRDFRQTSKARRAMKRQDCPEMEVAYNGTPSAI